MNESDLSATLTGIHADRRSLAAPPTLRLMVRAIPSTTPQQRGWLPTITTWRFQSMFSATKFVIAGAIVALFGGFLLSGVLTQQSDDQAPAAVSSAAASPEAEPTTKATAAPETSVNTDLLPGVALVTEEVEPGVLRVLDDGAGHDLVAEPLAGLTIGPDGSVWLFSSDGSRFFDSMFDLGQEDSNEVRFRYRILGFYFDMAFGPDDTVWARLGADGTLGSFDGSSWTTQNWPNGSDDVGGIEATPDGAVWVAREVRNGPGPRVARIDDGEWTVLPTLDDPALEGSYHGAPAYFDIAPDGTVWLGNGFFHGSVKGTPTNGLLRFDGDRWEVVTPVSDRPDLRAGPLAVGPDGTLWVYLQGPRLGDRFLARHDDEGWSVFSEDDGVPLLVMTQSWESRFEVDADGTLWIPFRGDFTGSAGTEADRCPGVLSFDGSAWQQYLAGGCAKLNHLAVDPDGSVWVTVRQADDETDLIDGLYVITPEYVDDVGNAVPVGDIHTTVQ